MCRSAQLLDDVLQKAVSPLVARCATTSARRGLPTFLCGSRSLLSARVVEIDLQLLFLLRSSMT